MTRLRDLEDLHEYVRRNGATVTLAPSSGAEVSVTISHNGRVGRGRGATVVAAFEGAEQQRWDKDAAVVRRARGRRMSRILEGDR